MGSPPAPVDLIPASPLLPERLRRRLERDHERLADGAWPAPLEDYIRAEYAIDLAARYGPLPIRNPIGKASGQLSLQAEQVRADVEDGLGFVVLKTVIAEDASGAARMEAWKVKAPRMVCERLVSRRGREGWTISWKGRGWEGSLDGYVALLESALAIGGPAGVPVIPSVKFHLPAAADEPPRLEEYRHTLARLDGAWSRACSGAPLVLEKDFSPTLAGSDRAGDRSSILRWLEEVPRWAREALPGRPPILGVKVMNALFEDEFQVEMLEALERLGGADFLVVFNRLFDPRRMFGGHAGIAVGGFDLSDRNLWALERRIGLRQESGPLPQMPLSGTGNIASGALIAEYALRGCTSVQLHTYFQLPREAYRSRTAGRSRAALHELLFHPAGGLIAAMAHVRGEWLGKPETDVLRFLDLPGIGRQRLLSK